MGLAVDSWIRISVRFARNVWRVARDEWQDAERQEEAERVAAMPAAELEMLAFAQAIEQRRVASLRSGAAALHTVVRRQREEREAQMNGDSHG